LASEQVDVAELERQFSKIMDPELGRSITEMRLIDKLDVSGSVVTVEFHLTAPFCPPVFALKIASDIKSAALSVRGVKAAQVTLRGHYLADAVNKQVNRPPSPAASGTAG
jgi:metal-sulfur cluster biosynthetic enzyme